MSKCDTIVQNNSQKGLEVTGMTSEFLELCKNVKLTKSEKAMADYILANFREVCFLTSTELAEKVGSSHSSVIRFSKDLGFSGFSALQQELRRQYDAYLADHDEVLTVPVEKLGQSLAKLSKDNISEALLDTVRNNLHYTMLNNSNEAMEKAAKVIVDARMKFIVGHRGCAGVASFLQIILRDTLPGVFANESNSLNAFDFLVDINEDDVLIVVSFPRYNKQARLSAQLAHEAGATVIVITDTPTAPIAEYADHIILTAVDSLTFFNSQVAPMFAAEMLCSYVCKIVGANNEERLKLVDKFTREMELF